MVAVKLRIADAIAKTFKELHPAYGERSRVFNELVEAYVFRARQSAINQAQARKAVIQDAVKRATGEV